MIPARTIRRWSLKDCQMACSHWVLLVHSTWKNWNDVDGPTGRLGKQAPRRWAISSTGPTWQGNGLFCLPGPRQFTLKIKPNVKVGWIISGCLCIWGFDSFNHQERFYWRATPFPTGKTSREGNPSANPSIRKNASWSSQCVCQQSPIHYLCCQSYS